MLELIENTVTGHDRLRSIGFAHGNKLAGRKVEHVARHVCLDRRELWLHVSAHLNNLSKLLPFLGILVEFLGAEGHTERTLLQGNTRKYVSTQ